MRTTENNTTNEELVNTGALPGRALSAENMNEAMERVVSNRGAAGIDRMTVEELEMYLRAHGNELRTVLWEGKYKPNAVRRAEIPKDNGKKRMPGIPTVVDRVVQQAIAQVRTPICERKFSETSYGFRVGKSAHDAIRKATEYMNDGYVRVEDMDLERFSIL